MTRLNLGAGRVILPVTPETQYPHLAPMPDGCFEKGWLNVDKYHNPGIQEVIDLFVFPWIRSSNGSPFNDNSVDEIYCSHIVEHIPHQVRQHPMIPVNWMRKYESLINDYDGWFVFFTECWRILKPSGLIHIVTPYGASYAGMGDPTHTRYILPASFSYFTPNPNAPFDYHLPCEFKAVSDPLLIFTEYGVEYSKLNDDIALRRAMSTQYNIIDEIRLTMEAVKDADSG